MNSNFTVFLELVYVRSFPEINILLLAYNLCIYTIQYCSIMVTKAAADGSFLRRENRGLKLTMLFAKVFVSLFFIHFECGQIIRMGVYFLFNSVNTRIQFALTLLLNSVFILE